MIQDEVFSFGRQAENALWDDTDVIFTMQEIEHFDPEVIDLGSHFFVGDLPRSNAVTQVDLVMFFDSIVHR